MKFLFIAITSLTISFFSQDYKQNKDKKLYLGSCMLIHETKDTRFRDVCTAVISASNDSSANMCFLRCIQNNHDTTGNMIVPGTFAVYEITEKTIIKAKE